MRVIRGPKQKEKEERGESSKNHLSFCSTLGSVKTHRFIRLKWRVLENTLSSSFSLTFERKRESEKGEKGQHKKTTRETKVISYIVSTVNKYQHSSFSFLFPFTFSLNFWHILNPEILKYKKPRRWQIIGDNRDYGTLN